MGGFLSLNYVALIWYTIVAINLLICSRFTCNPTEGIRKIIKHQPFLILSLHQQVSRPILSAGSGKVVQCKQPKPRETHSFLCNARERLSHATTLAFRYYVSFLQSQDIMDLIESRSRLGLLSLLCPRSKK